MTYNSIIAQKKREELEDMGYSKDMIQSYLEDNDYLINL